MALSARMFRQLILEPVIAEYMRDYQEFHRAFSAIAAVDAYAAHIFTEARELVSICPSGCRFIPMRREMTVHSGKQ